ncbi:MAG TPA: hypothetical protein VH680_03350 [Gemmatimonadales bacterium]|jgi:hypothetical protein
MSSAGVFRLRSRSTTWSNPITVRHTPTSAADTPRMWTDSWISRSRASVLGSGSPAEAPFRFTIAAPSDLILEG